MAVHALASVDDALGWLAARGARRLVADSRRVAAGDGFIAWPGHAHDARRFVPQALDAGAVGCIVEQDGADAFAAGWGGMAVAALPRLKAACGPLASRFVGEPSRTLDVVACTGTNGKTSMAWWTAQALTALGRRCGVVGTLGVGEPPLASASMAIASTGLTTPDPITLQSAFRDFADRGFGACALEASSIGLAEHRLAGTAIDVALFSNFTLDHLDFHGSMDAYWQAKAPLFRWPGLRAAVVNLDDAQGRVLAESVAEAGGVEIWTYAVERPARLLAADVGYRGGGLVFEVREGAAAASVATGLIGSYNVSNLLAVLGGLRALGVPLAAAADACAVLTPVPGRMQRVAGEPDAPQVVVDYAHTPDALDKALLALRPLADERGGRLWCVFGCGGNRDARKRPLMGAIAARRADKVVVTSDNPRLEPADAIIGQILGGAGPSAVAIPDRGEAIANAVAAADARDVILVAGKGHETTQEIGGVRRPFSDADEASKALRARPGAAA